MYCTWPSARASHHNPTLGKIRWSSHLALSHSSQWSPFGALDQSFSWLLAKIKGLPDFLNVQDPCENLVSVSYCVWPSQNIFLHQFQTLPSLHWMLWTGKSHHLVFWTDAMDTRICIRYSELVPNQQESMSATQNPMPHTFPRPMSQLK